MKAIKGLLPEELIEILNNPPFDNDAGLIIETVKFNETGALLTFSIRFYEDSAQIWEIMIEGLEEERIIRNWSQTVEVYKEHPLLLEYHDLSTELYFSGTTVNAEALFIDIVESLQLMNNAMLIAKYLLWPDSIRRLSQQEYGLFARGPKTILKIYGDCLTKHGIKPIFIGEHYPPTENKSLKLLTLGDSYFIGKSFMFERKQ